MRKWFRMAFIIHIMVVITTSCDDRADDPYFARPADLASPIYQNLQEMGRFTNFLTCIDKSGYADVLKSAGYYTVFAPNDDAFSDYLESKGLDDAAQIDSITAKEIVSYALVFTAYTTSSIDDVNNIEVIPNRAFRRKTSRYKGVYKENATNLGEVDVVDINRVVDEEFIGEIPMLNVDDNNYKYIPVITSPYMDMNGLTAFDYNYFYPSASFSGFNIADANVVTADIQAENGYIHEIDKVIEPIDNIEETLAKRDEYSLFKELLDKYLVNYNLAPDEFTTKYQLYSGSTNPVYVKSYPWLLYSPNTETYTPAVSGASIEQVTAFTMFAPNNAAVQKFYDEKFLVHYGALDNMSQELISDFVNSHLYISNVWPGKFELADTRFSHDDILEAQMASNGFFYGTNKVKESDKFFSTFGEINLNPNYSLMLQGLKDFGLQYIIMNSNLEFTVFMVPNDVMTEIGFSYDPARSSWGYTPDPTVAPQSLERFLRMHIVRREINDFSEEGMILTYGNEYIKYEDGHLYAAGNYDESEEPLPVEMDETPTNGVTYKFLDTPLRFSTKAPMEHLEANPDYKYFCDFIKNSIDLYDDSNQKIRDLNGGVPNTIFALNNSVIFKAIMAGLLPRTTLPATLADQDKVKKFFRYHFLIGKSIAYGLPQTGEYPTAYKNVDGKTYVTITSEEGGKISVTDRQGKMVSISETNNNILSNRVVIHELDDYLNPNE